MLVRDHGVINRIEKGDYKLKKVIFIVILIVIVGCKAKEPVITGYDTKTAWVPDASKGLIELEYDLATEYYYDLLKDDNLSFL